MKTKISSVFAEKDYREALNLRQKQLKNTLGKSFSMGEFANAIRVQRTYLSKVIAGSADLSDDQLFMAIKYLKFSDAEGHYLRILHSYQRSGLADRKRELEKTLYELRQDSLRADRHLETELVHETQNHSTDYQKYFLDPMVQLVHMFLTVDKYRKHHAEIISALHLSEGRWQEILSTLIELRLIAVQQNEIVVTQEHIMLSKDSPLANAYHMSTKANAHSRLQALPLNQKNSFSMIFTCGRETTELIRLQLIEFLKATEHLARADDKASEVYQISLDLFPWT